MFQISRDSPAYYLTSVTHKRLPVFRLDEFKKVVADAFNEARSNHKFLIFAYVIMPDHTHVLTDNAHEIKATLRYLNGISAHRIIWKLILGGHQESLAKLRVADRGQNHKHSVYEHHANAIRITGEDAFIQKVNYIHLNPVRAGLVAHPDDYLYSSARQWHLCPFNTEPLLTDHERIDWRR